MTKIENVGKIEELKGSLQPFWLKCIDIEEKTKPR